MGQIVYKTDNGQELSQKEIEEIRNTSMKDKIKTGFALIGIAAVGLFLFNSSGIRQNDPDRPASTEA